MGNVRKYCEPIKPKKSFTEYSDTISAMMGIVTANESYGASLVNAAIAKAEIEIILLELERTGMKAWNPKPIRGNYEAFKAINKKTRKIKLKFVYSCERSHRTLWKDLDPVVRSAVAKVNPKYHRKLLYDNDVRVIVEIARKTNWYHPFLVHYPSERVKQIIAGYRKKPWDIGW